MEIRTLTAPPEINGKTVTGYAARFNSASEIMSEGRKTFRELILPGAFTRSLANPPRGDVLALWLHGFDKRPPLGRTPNTLRLWEDSQGLGFELQLPDSAADVREAIQRKDVTGMSFGFESAVDRWYSRDGIAWREVREAPLFEISFAIHPAYKSTSIQMRDISSVTVPDFNDRASVDRAKKILQVIDRT